MYYIADLAAVNGREGCVKSRSSLPCPKKCIKYIPKKKCFLCKPGCTTTKS